CPHLHHILLRPPPLSTLFPYTTLFRSRLRRPGAVRGPRGRRARATGRGAPHHRLIRLLDRAVPPCRPGPLPAGRGRRPPAVGPRSEEHTSELQSRFDLVCRLLLEKKNN